MHIENTISKLNISGANQKELIRIDGKLAIRKNPIQDGTYDNEAELMVKKLADYFEIPCCEVLIDSNCIISIFDEKWSKKRDFESLLDVSCSVDAIFDLLPRMCRGTNIMDELSSVLLFDIITRQLDRNFTNIAICLVDDKLTELYPLYDNGLSLFSTSTFNNSTRFQTVLGNSEQIINRCLEYDVSKFLSYNLTNDILIALWRNIPNHLYHDNKLNDIIDWVVSEYRYIQSKLSN